MYVHDRQYMLLALLYQITQVVTLQGDALTSLTCSPTPSGYLVADPKQCDRYAECSPDGVKKVRLCPDGLVVSLERVACDLPAKVDCSSRPLLQDPQPRGLCPRSNGVFPLETSCTRYVDCRGGQVFLQNCGAGAVFDPVLGCVHPDMTRRPGCTAEDQYKFDCPNPKELASKSLKFGDHLRLPHPTDCSLFYACLVNGQPRLLSCERPSVFNALTELCEAQENVPGCENTYNEEATNDSVGNAIRERLEKEIALLRKSGLFAN